jgi:hypothetical protein
MQKNYYQGQNYYEKNSFFKIILALYVISLFACKNGKDGQVYLAINGPTEYCYSFTSYTDNNPSIPIGFATGYHYNTEPGTYSYDYYVSSTCGFNSYHCFGNYTLIQNPGTKWNSLHNGFLTAGKDGEENKYCLDCHLTTAILQLGGRYPIDNNASYTTGVKDALKPIKFDTTYYTNGNALRVEGTIIIGEMPTTEIINKSKFHK